MPQPGQNNALTGGTPKMPGEPPRVQPSKKNPLNWENAPSGGERHRKSR